ncbi:hypothetical protein O4H53_22380 [Sulfitobacter sp. G21635-S1]|uniref:hypothetical protein n=1 Tax=Sulfitobacter sp. G21635-S1 TaxID=3014043 RepID=UPI0022AEDD93|nr:hypothetical protein [Sulfitobacter sp. G21635-S1]MCZ4258302.1 hypothetical protein [Sulfitobacter sp. G21635-S1]
MAVELIPKMPAQDFAVLSYGNTARKFLSFSLKTDAISGVITMVLLRSIPCEGSVSARFSLRKRQRESQDLGDLRGGESGSAQDDVPAEKEKRSAGFFFAI